ncbi:polysaccharide biosynthesis protein [Eubacteriales bacterium KG127]
MFNNRILLNKWDSSRVYRILLLVFDIFAIYSSSALAMMARFNSTLNGVPKLYFDSIMGFTLYNIIFTVVVIYFCRLYNSIWRFASLKEILYIFNAALISTVANFLLYFGLSKPIFRSYFPLYFLLLFAFIFIGRFSYRFIRTVYRKSILSEDIKNVMVVGAGEAGNFVIRELEISNQLNLRVVCVVDDDKRKHGTYIQGIKVCGGRDKIPVLAKMYDVDEIIIALPSVPKSVIKDILNECQKTDCEIKILPGMYQLVSGEVEISKLRNIEIEDLLGREPIQANSREIGIYVAEKTVLVTGAGGSIGSELSRQIAANYPRKLVLFDIYENTLYDIQRELQKNYPNLDLEVLIGSVRNRSRVNQIFEEYRPDVIFHAAAHKHVPLMEDSPKEAVKNNVFGTMEVCKAADTYEAEKFVLISTDKAVNPTNVMGATKRICEMLIQYYNNRSKTNYVAVRFGNVLGSNGSVIPYFKKQIADGGPVTVTHPDIIRYFMTIPEAVSLVLKAGASAGGGEIFVLDMGEPVKILDLAKNMIKLSGHEVGADIEIVFTGLRPGEKLYEELLMDEEGLEKTENKLIYIGKPIKFDEQHFETGLRKLYRIAYSRREGIRKAIKEIVPTYKGKLD